MRVPLRIFCCDDSASFLILLEDWLRDHGDLELAGTSTTRADALTRLRDAPVDVVVTDTFAPFGDPAFLRDLRAAVPDARLVLYTGYAPHELPAEVTGAVDAVVRKDADESGLVAAVRQLARP